MGNTVVIYVGNVKSKVQNLPMNLANKIAKELSVKVPNYWFSTAFKMGRWDGTQKFFIRPANTFPTGLLKTVVNMISEQFELPLEIQDERKGINDLVITPVEKQYTIGKDKNFREYQVEALNAVITNKVENATFVRGVINLATNAGKTTVAEGLINELYPKLKKGNQFLLFVTHSKEIAYQAQKSIETDLGIKVGIIGDGKWELKTVTVAIVSTLYKRMKDKKPEFKFLVENVTAFIADEVHHSSSQSWYDVLCSFTNASIRVGLTGTVDKSNPVNEMRLYSCTGPVVTKVSNDFLIQKGYSAKPICIMFLVGESELDDIPYSDAYNLGIIENEERLQVIHDICCKETKDNNKVLVLVEYLEHGNIINEKLKNLKKQVYFTNGQLSSEERQKLLDDLKMGKLDVLISTSILDEGVDVSGINAIIYARGMKSTRKLLQGIGRGLRKKKDGSPLRFYDFIDNTNLKLLQHSQNRYEVLKKEKFTVKLMNLEDYNKMSWKDINKEDKPNENHEK